MTGKEPMGDTGGNEVKGGAGVGFIAMAITESDGGAGGAGVGASPVLAFNWLISLAIWTCLSAKALATAWPNVPPALSAVPAFVKMGIRNKTRVSHGRYLTGMKLVGLTLIEPSGLIVMDCPELVLEAAIADATALLVASEFAWASVMELLWAWSETVMQIKAPAHSPLNHANPKAFWGRLSP